MATATTSRQGRPAHRSRKQAKRRSSSAAIGGWISATEFEVRYADVPFCELERGEVIYLTAGGWKHSRISLRIAFLLERWAEKTKRGRVLVNEAGLITERNPDTVRGVDVMYFSYRRVPDGKEPEGFAETPPELAVEVVGKKQGWKKMVQKAGEYLALGADRVWIVDPGARTLHVFMADKEPSKYDDTATIRDDAILPGFSCKVSEFFKS